MHEEFFLISKFSFEHSIEKCADMEQIRKMFLSSCQQIYIMLKTYDE